MARRKPPESAQPLPAGAEGALPVVAIVGRPNVGKSTLFNRLAGERLAIVEDMPGVTRDRHYAEAWILGRPCVLVDTGGFDPHSDDPMREGIAHHVRLALEEAELVVCVLDATSEALPADREAVHLLREANKPVIFVAELVREAILHRTFQEVPHSVAVEIEEMQEDGELTRIGAMILVDRPTHKGILIGAGGAMLKAIGTDARLEIEKLLDKKVFLRLFVKVDEDWTRDAAKVRRVTREPS